MSNYPDDIHDYDSHPDSPFYEAPEAAECPHCKEFTDPEIDGCEECGKHTHEMKCCDCGEQFIPENEQQYMVETCEECLEPEE